MSAVLALQVVSMHEDAQQRQRVAELEQRLANASQQLEQLRAVSEANAPREAYVDALMAVAREAEEAERQRLADEEARRAELASRGVARQLSVEVTGDSGGGVTATGQDVNTSREGAMCIAVDPAIIPLGSHVRLSFEEPWSHLNGVYLASDTGGAIIGNIVDLYFGVDGYDEAIQFGRRMATAEVLY